MSKYIIFPLVLFILLPVLSGFTMEKEGKFSVKFGWSSKGQVYEVGPEHVFFVGEFSGTMFNDKGEGFLNMTSAVCPGSLDINKGMNDTHGYCVITDTDGDKAYLVWKCKGEKLCNGDQQWTGGTGKYEGITGNTTLSALPSIGGTQQGYSIWEGGWKLP